MRMQHVTIAAGMLGMFTTISGEPVHGQSSKPSGGARVSPLRPNTFAMLPCNDAQVTGDPVTNFVKVMRVVVPASLDLSNLPNARYVRVKGRQHTDANQEDLTEDADDGDPARMGNINDGKNTENKQNAFHIELKGTNISADQWVKVRVVLTHPNYDFAEDTDLYSMNFSGVGVTDFDHYTSFCFLRVKPRIPGVRLNPVAIFFVKNWSGARESAGFNIGIKSNVANKNQQTPIYIDPKVTNSG